MIPVMEAGHRDVLRGGRVGAVHVEERVVVCGRRRLSGGYRLLKLLVFGTSKVSLHNNNHFI